MKKLLLFAENCFVVIGLTFFMGGLTPGASADGVDTGLVPEIIVTMIRYFIWFVSALLLLLNGKRTLITMRRDWILWILTFLVLFSFAWSDFPEWTLLGNREIAQMTCFGLYIATRFSLREQVKLYAVTFGIGAIASAAFAIAMPSVGLDIDHVGAWRGLYGHKNVFGSMMVMTFLAFFALPVERPLDRWIKRIGIGGAAALILLSTSRTALVLAFTLLALMWFYRNYRWQGKRSIVLGSLGVLVGGAVTVGILTNWVALLTALGRDPTLTGRTYIWKVSLNYLLERPLFGFGRSSFWAPDSPYPRAISTYLSQSFRAPHAHNGFIEIALDVGLVGLALFLICYVSGFLKALMRAYGSKHPEHIWSLGFLTFLALNNMTESYMLRLANVYWVLFIATLLTVKQRMPIFEDEPELPLLTRSYRELPQVGKVREQV
ncbi:O-antigen ligase family protein [Pseudanabaenaceae cyanobacterium LEGE 13415]|nr:O-antigen ligase family protein [Pseudanabaenaceae cyanobacterium LEGE 13415]